MNNTFKNNVSSKTLLSHENSNDTPENIDEAQVMLIKKYVNLFVCIVLMVKNLREIKDLISCSCPISLSW